MHYISHLIYVDTKKTKARKTLIGNLFLFFFTVTFVHLEKVNIFRLRSKQILIGMN